MKKRRWLVWPLVFLLFLTSAGCGKTGSPKTVWDVLRRAQSLSYSERMVNLSLTFDGFTVRVMFDGTQDSARHAEVGSVWLYTDGKPGRVLDPYGEFPDIFCGVGGKVAEAVLADGLLTLDLTPLLETHGSHNLAAMVIAMGAGDSFAGNGGTAALSLLSDSRLLGLAASALGLTAENLETLLASDGLLLDVGAFSAEAAEAVVRLRECAAGAGEAGNEEAKDMVQRGSHRDEYLLGLSGEAWSAFLPAAFSFLREDGDARWADVSLVCTEFEEDNPALDALEDSPLVNAVMPMGLTVTEVREYLRHVPEYQKPVDMVLHAGNRIGRELAEAGFQLEGRVTYARADDGQTVKTEWELTADSIPAIPEAGGTPSLLLTTERRERKPEDMPAVPAIPDSCLEVLELLEMADIVYERFEGYLR